MTAALEELNYYAAGETPANEDVATALSYLNRMIAGWSASGVIIGFPTVTEWLGAWVTGKAYVIGDGVNVSGRPYVCILGHSSTSNDEPGPSIDWATYWTEYAFTPLSLTSTFPLPYHHEEGVISMLAVRIAPTFNEKPDALTIDRANTGWIKISSEYMRTPAVIFDPALSRTPSRRWPYTSTNIIEG